jgi:thiol:disulfide interchange protein DsbC
MRMFPMQVFLIALAAALAGPLASTAFAFGEEGCGAGLCSDCHSLDRQEAEKLLTGLVDKVHSVDFAIVPGLWKVEVEGKGQKGTVYMDFSKSYVVSGRVLRLADWTDVSAGTVSAAPRQADLSKIPLEMAPVVGSRDAPVKVVVFTDPQCPYCIKLHEEIKKVVARRPDVAFSLVLFPLPSHPDAHRIARSVVCEQSLELLEEACAGRPVPDPRCETDIVDRWLETGEAFGIGSTPTLVLPDGTILSGFKPAEKLLEILGKTSPSP